MAGPRLEPICSPLRLAALNVPVEEALKGLQAWGVAVRLKADSLPVCLDGCEQLNPAQLVLYGHHYQRIHVHSTH